MPEMISEKIVARLCLYRRVLEELEGSGESNIFSHELAERAGVSAAQLRRDIMEVGYAGSPTRGYDINGLQESITKFLYGNSLGSTSIIGIGNIGRAILSYIGRENFKINVTACFDEDSDKVGNVFYGCRCYNLNELPERTKQYNITSAILAVPEAAAQGVADRLIESNIKGIMNFAPVKLKVPGDVYVENINLGIALEKVHYFARGAK